MTPLALKVGLYKLILITFLEQGLQSQNAVQTKNLAFLIMLERKAPLVWKDAVLVLVSLEQELSSNTGGSADERKK